MEPDSYPPVPHSHIVPAGYLRAWAQGKQIAMRQPGATASRLIGVRDAGVRKNFYRRERPATGETTYDVEWSLSQAENAALPIIAHLPARWPLDLEDRGRVGQFFALQHLRGPAFQQWHDGHVGAIRDSVRADPENHLKPPLGRTAEEVIDEIDNAATGDTYRLTQMMKHVRSIGIVFASMHWTLVAIRKGRFVTSDHPVVIWPMSEALGRRPQSNDLNAGVLDTLEHFVPIGPEHLLLMTWRNRKSNPLPVACEARHVATVNTFVVANADAQWFHEPGIEPWLARGRRQALAPQLLTGYDPNEAWFSRRRAQVRELAKAEARRPLSNDEVAVLGEDGLPGDVDVAIAR